MTPHAEPLFIIDVSHNDVLYYERLAQSKSLPSMSHTLKFFILTQQFRIVDVSEGAIPHYGCLTQINSLLSMRQCSFVSVYESLQEGHSGKSARKARSARKAVPHATTVDEFIIDVIRRAMLYH